MSTTQPSGSPDGVQPTRQQLDELDALLQRMLALPVHQLENTPPPPTDPSAAPPAPAAAPTGRSESGPPVSYVVVETAGAEAIPPSGPPQPTTLRLVREPEANSADQSPSSSPATPATPPPEDDWIPLRSAWSPSAQTWGPLAESWRQARDGGSASPAPTQDPPAAAEVPPPEPPSPIAPLPLPATDTPADPPVPEPSLSGRFRRALVGFDATFYHGVGKLGSTGRWLARPPGRTFLGVVGVVCLAAAAAFALADGLGWMW
jgi:hypothetical protein